MVDKLTAPFLRWAGGKRWLAAHLAPVLRTILDESEGTYYEPFLGAASMYFGLAPQKSVLSDLNKELIETFIEVRDSWQLIEQKMKSWQVTKEKYYEIRSYKPRSSVNKAARFIWLNRICYGGLYRVNKNNQFNVPYGGGERTPEVLYKNETLKNCSEALKGQPHFNRAVELLHSDFEGLIGRAQEGDVVYCDPTYSQVTRDSFDRYGSSIFDWFDQNRLATAAMEASKRGAIIIISNGFSPEIKKLFPFDHIIKISKKKTIGNRAACNIKHMEYLFVMDPLKKTAYWKRFSKSIGGNYYRKPHNTSVVCLSQSEVHHSDNIRQCMTGNT